MTMGRMRSRAPVPSYMCQVKGNVWFENKCMTPADHAKLLQDRKEAEEKAKKAEEIAKKQKEWESARALNMPVFLTGESNETPVLAQKRSEINTTRRSLADAKYELLNPFLNENQKIPLKIKVDDLQQREIKLLKEYQSILTGKPLPVPVVPAPVPPAQPQIVVADKVPVAIQVPPTVSLPAIEALSPAAAAMVTKQIVNQEQAVQKEALAEIKQAAVDAKIQAQTQASAQPAQKKSNFGLMAAAGIGATAIYFLTKE